MRQLLPLSALQHFLYCPRQCALIHVEKVWVENKFTVEGRILHQRADAGKPDRRAGIAEDRAVPLRSNILGVYGVADVIEMRPDRHGNNIPYPVEYKRGKPKPQNWDRAQLCAQAICLEEMLTVQITEGAIFYGMPRRRERVTFSQELRAEVIRGCENLHTMIQTAHTPKAQKGPRCKACSLLSICLPSLPQKQNVATYIQKGLLE